MATQYGLGGKSASWPIISTRIPPAEHKKLIQRHPEKGKRSSVLRALLQMYLAGKIGDLTFTHIEKI
jgi:hypothetical protein